MNHLDKLATAFQNRVEELRRKKEGSGTEETEEEEKIEDAKENESTSEKTISDFQPLRIVLRL